MEDVNEIKSFIVRYKDFSKILERQKIIYYKAKFSGLFNGYSSLRNLIIKINTKEAFDYNIFEILNIKTAEVKTHTPFLRNLLDVNGTHGQSNLFINSFIKSFIPIKKRDCFLLNDFKDYYIEEEKVFLNGRIDLIIQSLDPEKRFAIIIENKIYARDQYRQLTRYNNFLKTKKLDNCQKIIFYLTPNGINPSSESISNELLTELKDNNILYNISYKKDIVNWLNGIIEHIQSNKIKYQIEQYLKIISNL